MNLWRIARNRRGRRARNYTHACHTKRGFGMRTEIAILARAARRALARGSDRIRTSQLRAALRLEQTRRHLGHGHRVRSAQPAQLRAHRGHRRERQDAGIRVRVARHHAAHAQRHHARDAEGRDGAARRRLAVAPQPATCASSTTSSFADGRALSVNGPRGRAARARPPSRRARTSSARGCSRRSPNRSGRAARSR